MIKTYTLGGQPVRIDTNLSGRNVLERVRQWNPRALEKTHPGQRFHGFMGHLISWWRNQTNYRRTYAVEVFALDLDTRTLVPFPANPGINSYSAATSAVKKTLDKASVVKTPA